MLYVLATVIQPFSATARLSNSLVTTNPALTKDETGHVSMHVWLIIVMVEMVEMVEKKSTHCANLAPLRTVATRMETACNAVTHAVVSACVTAS